MGGAGLRQFGCFAATDLGHERAASGEGAARLRADQARYLPGNFRQPLARRAVQRRTQARHGTAEFKALTAGRFGVDMIQSEFPPNTTDWSLGFEETSPGVWKVDRINLTRSPRGFIGLPQAR